MRVTVSLLIFSLKTASSNDNGLALTPPMGWRSWNLFGASVNQTLMLEVMDAITTRKREVDGVPTSLCDVGYCDVGLDDNWQLCDSSAKSGATYHDEDGRPIVNKELFPDMKGMVDYAHSMNLTAGFYGNNCICVDRHDDDKKYYEGDVEAFIGFGFDGWKLDGCGAQTDLELFDSLLNATGKAVVVENCHWGIIEPALPTTTWCPWNMYRTSDDIHASYVSMIYNLNTTIELAEAKLSYPGCWAYPDMLEVGCEGGGGGGSGMTDAETRTHFAAWSIVSSPLVLSLDVRDDEVMDKWWELITNKEAIAVNQAWAGHSGSPFYSSEDMEHFDFVDHNPINPPFEQFDVPKIQYFYKEMPNEKAALLLMNRGKQSETLTLNLADVPNLACTEDKPCSVRDILKRENVESASDGLYYFEGVESHDSVFLLVQ